MIPAPEDLRNRKPVWVALSELFLDTDTTLSRASRVEVLAASPYTMEELQEILVAEVYPVCGRNLRSVAGEWAGFDEEWLTESILRGCQSTRQGWRRLSPGRFTVLLSAEWRQTRAEVVLARSMTKPHPVAEPLDGSQRPG